MKATKWGFLILVWVTGARASQLNQYSIPVSEQLRPWATFTIKEAHLRVRRGRAQLEYQLPPELSSEETKISGTGKFYGFDEPISVTGKFIKSCTCTLNGDLAHCELKYRPELSALSPEGKSATETRLRNSITNPEELERRLEVLGEFINGSTETITDSHEAGGVFERLEVRYR